MASNACNLDLLPVVVVVVVLLCASTAAITSAQPAGFGSREVINYNYLFKINAGHGMEQVVAVAMAMYNANVHIMGLSTVHYQWATEASYALSVDRLNGLIMWYRVIVYVTTHDERGQFGWVRALEIYYAVLYSTHLPTPLEVIHRSFYARFVQRN
ncbi:hypothetical protein AXF42_Ash020939 [Apostasia shenzhenica]|uniref:Cysteine proteinase inhibitor n=1 Tax=Apostasia shenzhenica TaxID=1088818 RepID=A0A2H9ZYN4_9ASPA|nr:hypothetical protein AXF42_Ash020939 [Apostasia shenzhenica]